MEADATASNAGLASGLSTAEAERLLAEYGPNAVAEQRQHPIRSLAKRFWAPVPWMLEAAVLLEILLHKNVEAGVIGLLLVFNAGLGFAQENQAQGALALLRRRLSILARVRRDGAWQRIPAERLVPGDVIHVRVGDVVPADAKITDGSVQIDLSALTGESIPAEKTDGDLLFSGGMIRRGEATATIVATAGRTYFGRTAELVRQASAAGHLQQMIFTIVKYLLAFDVILAVLVLAWTLHGGMALADVLPFCLMLLVASIPVALPATFTVASALGTRELAEKGVLVSHLAAIEEAAAMDTLATDKTGTLTKNELTLAAVEPVAPSNETDVLRFAVLASDESTQDAIDLAILAAARQKGIGKAEFTVVHFTPFDPSTKCSEALVRHGAETIRIVKGAPVVVARMAGLTTLPQADRLAGEGYRVLAVATGQNEMKVAGFLALLDPPREESAGLVASLRDLGIRVLMITGDGLATARSVATRVGITGSACTAETFRSNPAAVVAECDVFAGVLPEDKFQLVRTLQGAGHVVGMTGDGVNDAPALKQAEVGVAVSNATDVAKAAASIVLTSPGLEDVIAAVETSRRIYQRMLTYTLNKIIKTLEIALFLSLGVVILNQLVVTPLMIVLLLFTNDFLTMSIATDNVSFSRQPEQWRVRSLVITAAPLAAFLVVFSLLVLLFGARMLGLGTAEIQTLAFLTLVFGGQGTVYLVRERGHFWRSVPSRWMLLSTSLDLAAVSILAVEGILMAPLRPVVVVGLLIVVLVFLFVVDYAKIGIFRRFGLY